MIEIFSILVIFFAVVLYVLNSSRLGFLHPGGLILILSIFYGVIPYLLLKFFPLITFQVYPLFFDLYSESILDELFVVYVFSLLGFFFGETCLFIRLKGSIRGGNNFKNPRSVPIYFSSIIYVLLVGVFFYIKYEPIGGYLNFISQASRRDSFEYLYGGWARYEMFFYVAFFSLLILWGRTEKLKVKYILVPFSLIYFSHVIMSGGRLELAITLVTLFFYFSAIHREAIRKNKFKIFGFFLAFFVVMSLFSQVRSYMRDDRVMGSTDSFEVRSSMLIPKEMFASYISGFITLREREYYMSSVFNRIIPSKVAGMMGVEKEDTLPRKMSVISVFSSGIPVHVVPFQLDLRLLGFGFIGVMLISSLVYLFVINLYISGFRGGGWFRILISMLLVMNVWYMMRVDLSNWFPRLYQTLFVACFFYILYLLFSAVLKRKGYEH